MEKIIQNGKVDWLFWCPGCKTHHSFTTKYPAGVSGPLWTKTGTDEEPSFSPSLQYKSLGCHLRVKRGMVHYLPDCQHAFKGEVIPMEPSL